jgi:protein-S-isoprenylcysteine O-methyltransferase Ste14
MVNIMDFGIASVAAITVITYVIGMAVKNTKLDNKWIPVICGVVGAILGVVGLATNMPDFPATDYITAIAVGIVSGLAATGVNQITKQLTNNE